MQPFSDRFIFHALHKSGSMFLYHYARSLASYIGADLFSANLPVPNEISFLEDLSMKGILAPYRKFKTNRNDVAKRIFILRDPLDILVSQFYSFAYMHVSDKNGLIAGRPREEFQQMGIDKYCLSEAVHLLARYSPIFAVHSSEDLLLTCYRTMVLDFRTWNDDVLTFLKVKEDVKEHLYRQFFLEFEDVEELTPKEIIEGNKKRHKRKMYPGDYKEKLKPETIDILAGQFAKVRVLMSAVSASKSYPS